MNKILDKLITITIVLILVLTTTQTIINILDMKKELSTLRRENQSMEEEIQSLKDYINELETPEEIFEESTEESIDLVKFEEDIPEGTDVISNREIDKTLFTEVLVDIAPNLLGIEDAMYENYEEYGIDPAFQLAVFCLESGYGTSSLSQNKNNICGHNAYPTSKLSSYENATEFDTKSDCVRRFGENINNMYISQGLVTVIDISQKYCPPNYQHWSDSVSSIMRRIDNDYLSLIR